jgi:hypothetical protein
MRAELNTPAEQSPAQTDAVRAALRRMPGMVLVWLGFGVLLGFVAPSAPGKVAMAAAATAGVIVLTPMGVVLALVGGRWRESLAGGLLGLLVVPYLMSMPGLEPRMMNAFGLIFGGIIGATVLTVLYRLPRLLWSFAHPAAHTPAA